MVLSVTSEEHLLYSLGYCVLILIISLLFRKFPPKKINWYYGYRTKRSMANPSTWKAANTYALNRMVKICLYSFLIPAFMYFINPAYILISTVIVNTLLILSIFFFTERFLDRTYDEKGNKIDMNSEL